MPRNCKVIATCFAGRELRPENDSCGDPPGLFLHAQNFLDADSVLELVSLIHEVERQVDPGAECDTIIVNNDVGWKKGNDYLDSIDGTKTFSGVFKVLHRKNFGSSLGAYNHAYETFQSQYDYWTFTEDDILINGDRWLSRCLSVFDDHDNVGFVAIQGLSNVWARHAHGGVGLAHVSILNSVKQAWGALPHRLESESQGDVEHTVFGEVLFTNIIERMGLRLVTVQSEVPLYTFAYDYMMRMRGSPVRTRRPKFMPRLLRKVSRLSEELADRID